MRVTRLGDARRRVVCVRRRWRRERLSERGESETAESRESRTRSRDMPPTRVRVTSRHISVSRKMCPGLRPAAPRTVLSRGVHARRAWRRGPEGRAGTGLECAVSVCTERTDTESENGQPNFLFQEPDTARACVPPPRLQCAMRMSIHTEGLHVDDHLVVFAWPPRPVRVR